MSPFGRASSSSMTFNSLSRMRNGTTGVRLKSRHPINTQIGVQNAPSQVPRGVSFVTMWKTSVGARSTHLHPAVLLPAAGGGVGYGEGADAVLDARCWRAVGMDCVHKGLHFEEIGIGEALDEEVMAAECEGAIGVQRGWLPGVDFGDHLAFGAVDLGPD